MPGSPADYGQYVDVGLPLVALLFGAIFVLTTIRLGREPRTWGRMVAIGAITGIVAAFRASLAIAGIAASDQPQSAPGAGVLIIDALLVLVALASAFVVLQGLYRGRDVPTGSGGLV